MFSRTGAGTGRELAPAAPPDRERHLDERRVISRVRLRWIGAYRPVMAAIEYRKVGAEVILSGQSEDITDPVVVKLPVDFRPPRELRFQVARESGIGSAVVGVDGNVTVDPSLGSGWVSLDTIRFIVD